MSGAGDSRSKGEATRARIVQAAMELINRRGFHAASMSELMRLTGLEKGGIYRHFESKEAIAEAAFARYLDLTGERLEAAIADRASPRARLLALVEALITIAREPIVEGGCMVMNLAIECDHGHAGLRALSRKAMDELQRMIVGEAGAAVEAGELKPDVEPAALAAVVAGLIEGAIMLSNLYKDARHADQALAHLRNYIEGLSA